MKYYLDTEFIEDGTIIDLISVGIAAGDGRELYLGHKDCKFERASVWVRENVLEPMGFEFLNEENYMRPIDPDFWLTKEEIGERIARFMGAEWDGDTGRYVLPERVSKPEIWGEYASTDWVAFYQIFGRMIDLPRGFPWRINEFHQERSRLGITAMELPQQKGQQHNAIEDAKALKLKHQFVISESQAMKGKSLNNAESLMGFIAWLTTREETVSLGATVEASSAADLWQKFSDANNLDPIRPDYYLNLVHPVE